METLQKKDVLKTDSHEANGKVEDSSGSDKFDPWNPPHEPLTFPVREFDHQIANYSLELEKWIQKTDAILVASRTTNIITPDRTPKWVNYALFKISKLLVPILKKDRVRSFLRLFQTDVEGLVWDLVITPELFDRIIRQNAVRCAKVILEGKAPELGIHRANPNYINHYGYFPLHQAAEMFSVDMIKLLFKYNALANLRTAVGGTAVENLLPLHIAVENTCQHKYLVENLLSDEEHQDYNQADANYVCKLIHLLCLPEMKICLDTIRLLAEKTDNLVDEIWTYIKDGKLVQTGVLLLAAQKQIRVNGFSIITKRILDHSTTLEMAPAKIKKERGKKQLEEKKDHLRISFMLVHTIYQAGEDLDAYIRSYQEVPPPVTQVPHEEVLGRVSSILKNYGFDPAGGSIDIRKLSYYPSQGTTEELALFNDGCAKTARKKLPRGWELRCARRSYFRDWRLVLASDWCPRPKPFLTMEEQDKVNRAKAMGSGFSPIANNNLGLVRRTPSLLSSHQSRRLFGTAALTVLKVLKKA